MTITSKSPWDKFAIVTDAGRPNGVRFAAALALAQQGADLKEVGVKTISLQADAAGTTFGKDIIDATLKTFPSRTIDILVNNTSTLAAHATPSEVPLEEFDTIFHIDFRSIFLLIQAADAHLTAPGARIINSSSVAARIGLSAARLYGGSKAALQ